MHEAIQCCSKWRFPASSAAPHTIQLAFILPLEAAMQTFTRLFKRASARVYLLRAPGLVLQPRSVDPVSVDGVPNVLNLYLKPHFMASVLADLGPDTFQPG